MQELNNLNLFIVGTAIAAMGILGFVVFFNHKSSVTNRTFLWFTLAAIAWNGINYAAYQFNSAAMVLWCLRVVLFCAVWYSFSLFHFFYVFPHDQIKYKKWFKYLLLPWVVVVSIITLTPLAITKVNRLSAYDSGASDVLGIGMAFFGATAVALIGSGIIMFVRKMRQAKPEDKQPYRLIFLGALLTFSFYVAYNFVLPTFFANSRLIPYGAIFTIPLIGMTGYSIIRHKLLSTKIISTELLVFALSLAVFFEVLVSGNTLLLIFRSFVFLLVLGVGIVLIRSVIREVQQREQLEVLSKELSAANEQLKVLDKARAEFISIASHQLRTPPATIKWYIGAIMDGDFGPLTEELRAALQRVESSNNGQISLIDDLLNASRIERGKMEFFFELGNVEELTRAAYDQLVPQAEMHKLKLIYQKPDNPLPQVMLDKEKVRQVVNNFIDNAIKYTKQGSVTVHFELTPTDVVVKITDTGRGVAADIAPTLFEKYTRGKDSATAASGLGLGLYVAKVVIEQNHGKIWVESKGEGQGATFAFSLPIHSDLKPTSIVDLTATQTDHK